MKWWIETKVAHLRQLVRAFRLNVFKFYNMFASKFDEPLSWSTELWENPAEGCQIRRHHVQNLATCALLRPQNGTRARGRPPAAILILQILQILGGLVFGCIKTKCFQENMRLAAFFKLYICTLLHRSKLNSLQIIGLKIWSLKIEKFENSAFS